MEALRDSEATLHDQLNHKIDRLSTSIKKQENQLEKINKMMSAIRPKMMFSDGLKRQQVQEKQIYECLSVTVSEQRKQCQKLRHLLEGKVKISETKRRAMELRGKAKVVKHIMGERAEGQTTMSSQSPGLGRESVPPAMHSPPQSQGLQRNAASPPQSSTFPFGASPLRNELSEEYAATETDTVRHEMNPGAQSSIEPSNQQSLQRQLQHLQHQQDILNAQGMVLATQGGMSGAQLQVFQSLMQQNKAMLPLRAANSSSESLLRRASDSGD